MTNEQKDAIKVLFARKNSGATCTDKVAKSIYNHLYILGDLDSLEGVILDDLVHIDTKEWRQRVT